VRERVRERERETEIQRERKQEREREREKHIQYIDMCVHQGYRTGGVRGVWRGWSLLRRTVGRTAGVLIRPAVQAAVIKGKRVHALYGQGSGSGVALVDSFSAVGVKKASVLR